MPRAIRLAAISAVGAAVYVGAFFASRLWALGPFAVPPVQLSAGVAFAVVILFGFRTWPAVAVGAALSYLWVGAGVWGSAAIAAVLTGEALFAAWLVRLIEPATPPFETVRGMFSFLAAVLLVTPLAAVVGTAASTGAAQFGVGWSWWLGDVTGILLVTPVMGAWARTRGALGTARGIEMLVLVGASFLMAELVFGGWFPTGVLDYPLAFLFLPFPIWAAFRLGLRGVTLSVFIIGVIATGGTAAGLGPFALDFWLESLVLLHGFILIMTVTGLSLSVTVAEREAAGRAYARQRDYLEHLVDTAQTAVILLDRRGRILRTNDYFERLTGYSSEEMRDKDWFETFVPANLRSAARRHFQGAIEGQPAHGNIGEVLTRFGHRRAIEWHESVIRGAQTGHTGVLMVGQDVTERIRTERELNRHRAHLEELVGERTTALARANEELSKEVGERRRVESELRKSREQLVAAQRIARVGSWEWDLREKRLVCSAELCRILSERTGEAPKGIRDLLRRVHPEDRRDVFDCLQWARRSGQAFSLEHRIVRSDGKTRLVEHRAEAQTDEDGTVVRFYGTVEDITERREAEEKLRRTAAVFENTTEAVAITDVNGTVTAVNRAFADISGYGPEDIMGRPLQTIQADPGATDAVESGLRTRGRWRGEVRCRHRQGHIYTAWGSLSAIRNRSGEVVEYVAVFTDISLLKRSQERLDYLAHHDALTELPNRLLFVERLQHTLTRATRHGTRVALMFLDLDRFKAINDTYGHAAGDRLLRAVADRLRRSVRAEDTVARLSGDEFTVIMDELGPSEDAALLAEKIIATVSQPVPLNGAAVDASVSVGIAVFPEDADNVDDLSKAADTAMYYAKHHGRNTYRFYTAELTSRAANLVATEHGLAMALERRELVLHYQPQIALDTGRICGAEALLRWQHPEEGLVPPGRFLAIAEESGLIEPIGEWVLAAVCEQVNQWREQGVPLPRVSINVSARQLQGGFMRRAGELLRETGWAGKTVLELEVPEEDLDMVAGDTDAWHALHESGVLITVDHFGGVCAHLAKLSSLPADAIKIDPSLAATLGERQDEFMDAIIQLGHRLSLNVIATGIEHQEQLERLRSYACDEAQGFVFSGAVPASRMAEMLRAEREGAH